MRFGLKSRCSRRKMNSAACKNSHPVSMYFFVMCVICESDTCLINRIRIFLSYIFPFGKNKKQILQRNTRLCFVPEMVWETSGSFDDDYSITFFVPTCAKPNTSSQTMSQICATSLWKEKKNPAKFYASVKPADQVCRLSAVPFRFSTNFRTPPIIWIGGSAINKQFDKKKQKKKLWGHKHMIHVKAVLKQWNISKAFVCEEYIALHLWVE